MQQSIHAIFNMSKQTELLARAAKEAGQEYTSKAEAADGFIKPEGQGSWPDRVKAKIAEIKAEDAAAEVVVPVETPIEDVPVEDTSTEEGVEAEG